MRVYTSSSRPVRMLEPYDGSAMFIGSYVLQLLLQFVFSMILVMTKVSESFLSTPAGVMILVILNETAILATPLAYSKIRGQNLYTQVGFRTRVNVWQILLAIAAAIATILAFAPIADAFVQFIAWTGYDVNGLTQMEVTSAGRYVLAIFFMCILPAVVEELLYRGMLSRAFADRSVVAGVLLSGLLFAIMHGNPVQLVHQFFLGCVCALLYYMTRSIWIPVIVHFCNNFYAVTGSYILAVQGQEAQAMPWWGSLICVIVGLAALAAVLYGMMRVSAKLRGKEQELAAVSGKGKWFKQLRILYFIPEEEQVLQAEQAALQQEYDACENQETREMLTVARKEEAEQIARRNRRALIYAILIGGVIWVINTITGYM